MNTTRDVVAPAMRAAAEDMCGDADAERVFTSDTRDLMGFFITCRRLLAECGIHDFSFADLYRPTHPRLVKLLSYIINFIRFREMQTAAIDEHFNKSERTKVRVDELFQANQAKEQQLSDLEAGRKTREQAVRRKEERSSELKNRLLELRSQQERITAALEREKNDVSRLKGVLEDKTSQSLNTRQEVEKLRPYTTMSPQALEAQLRDLSAHLANEKAQIEMLEKRARALQTSADAFVQVTGDVGACSRLLGDLGADLAREEEEASKATRHRDALHERGRNVADVERQEKLLQTQLNRVQDRTAKLHKGAQERAAKAQERMAELREVHRKLGEERGDRGRETERRRVRIEQTEKKMADLKENIENEVHAAHDEYLKMEAHIKLYITEMEQCIV